MAHSDIKEADLRICQLLQKVIFDKSQNVQTNEAVIREELVALPVAAAAGVRDTVSMYKQDTISMGLAHQAQVGAKKVDFVNGITTN